MSETYVDKVRVYLEMSNPDVIYFELNDWTCGRNYPDAEPFLSWMAYQDDYSIPLDHASFARENGICIAMSFVDMSSNFCISAPRSWVEKTCPTLLTEYLQFVCIPEENGEVYGEWGNRFIPYSEENAGKWEYRDENDAATDFDLDACGN